MRELRIVRVNHPGALYRIECKRVIIMAFAEVLPASLHRGSPILAKVRRCCCQTGPAR